MTRWRDRGAEARADPSATRWVVARPVAQFALIGLAAVVIVGTATATASRRLGQREAITDARTTTLTQAQGVVEPAIANGLVHRDRLAVAAVADVIEHQVIDHNLVRVKMWAPDGTIVYSNDHRLEGARFALGHEEVEALEEGLIKADVSDLSEPENRDERAFHKLLEVYLPVRQPDGERLLFEAYYRFDAVAASGRRIWRGFAPVSIGALVVLELLQIPLAWSLARRLRARQQEREVLLHRALEASDVERRRIASDLHDGAVQDLAGLAFDLAGTAREADVPPPLAARFDDAAAAVRATVTSLRSALVDIYPPDIAAHGLRAALDDLAGDAVASGLRVDIETPALPGDLPAPVAGLLYRAAREALRNAIRHAGASTVTIEAGAERTAAWVRIIDDGAGFDPAVLADKAADGHLGLMGLEGVVRDAGGTFEIASAPGVGTTIAVEVPVG